MNALRQRGDWREPETTHHRARAVTGIRPQPGQPGDIAPAWRAARARGKDWAKRVERARDMLPDEVQTALNQVGIDSIKD